MLLASPADTDSRQQDSSKMFKMKNISIGHIAIIRI